MKARKLYGTSTPLRGWKRVGKVAHLPGRRLAELRRTLADQGVDTVTTAAELTISGYLWTHASNLALARRVFHGGGYAQS